MSRIKLFSHTDLDGYGCNIVMKALGINVDETNINYGEINEVVQDYIQNRIYKNYDITFITDISINEEVAKLIDNTKDLTVILLDHHPTAEWLNKYEWACVTVNNTLEKTSGTEMLFNYLISQKK